jgi:hypothetical protein
MFCQNYILAMAFVFFPLPPFDFMPLFYTSFPNSSFMVSSEEKKNNQRRQRHFFFFEQDQ